MRKSKIIQLNRKNAIESMNKIPHHCTALILALEAATGEKYMGVGIVPEVLTTKSNNTNGQQ